jgi:hypothetical protein
MRRLRKQDNRKKVVKCRFRSEFEILNIRPVQTDERMVYGMRSLGHITSTGIVIQRMATGRNSGGGATALKCGGSLNILRGAVEAAGNHPEFHESFTRN